MSNSADKKKSGGIPLPVFIAGGLFILLLFGSLLYILLAAPGTGEPRKEVTKQYPMKGFSEFKHDDRALKKTDLLSKRIQELQQMLEQQAQSTEGLREDVRATLGDLNKDFTKAINDTRSAVNQLNERLNQLERLKSGVKEVRIVKPGKEARAPVSEPRDAVRGKKGDYKVRAVVDKRAWVATSDDTEHSVTASDEITPVPKTERVEDVDLRNGSIITSSN